MGAVIAPALVCATFGVVTGALMPRLLARLPEPENADDDKIPYAVLAARPGLPWMLALASGAGAGLLGLVLGWDPALLFLVYLCPVGVALGYVDWRLRLLPTALIAPSYLALGALVLVAWVLDRDGAALLGAVLGWLGVFGFYWLMWRFTPGMGYGDVRLAGLVGMSLGWFGWTPLVIGVYTGFLLGVLAWVPMRLLRLTRDRSYPFGPFMLLGVLVGAVFAGLTA